MDDQNFQTQLNNLELAHKHNLNALYERREAFGLEYESKLDALRLRQKQELDDLNQQYASKSTDPRSGIYQLTEFHKREMETFVKESSPDDPKYKLKLIAMKLRHRTEVIGLKSRLQDQVYKMETLHRAELDELAIKNDCDLQVSKYQSYQINIRYDLERSVLVDAFMYANKKYKVGDVLSDQDRTITVRWFSCKQRWHPWEKLDNSLDVSYGGYILDKNGTPKADGSKGSVFQSNVIE